MDPMIPYQSYNKIIVNFSFSGVSFKYLSRLLRSTVEIYYIQA